MDTDQALDLIFKYCPQIPFWPQLPRRDIREGMVAQFSEHVPCLEIKENKLIFNPLDKEKELEAFYSRIISEDLDYFKISPDFSSGLYAFYERLAGLAPAVLKEVQFIKCHVTGPFTFAASVKDESGVSLLHDGIFIQAIVKAITMKALWQISLFKKFGKKIIIFFDEPYLGCFGSAYTPINKEEVVNGLSELASAVKSEGALAGVHCCGNTDWSIFTDVSGMDIINFDAFSFLDRLALYGDGLKAFFRRDGILCWGMVPTNEFNGQQHSAQVLVEKIKDGINAFLNKGLDQDLLIENLLVSPACGLGTLDQDKAKRILQVLSEVSAFIRSPQNKII